MIYDAAFKRAGIVRVEEIADLFNCAEVLGMQPLPQGPNLAIITNAGGPGVMATDALIAKGGKLAKLSDKTLNLLNGVLPPFWSKGNPIDVLGDADIAHVHEIDATTSIHVAIGETAYVYGSEYDTSATNIVGTLASLPGDRAAWDALSYATRHTNDKDARE